MGALAKGGGGFVLEIQGWVLQMGFVDGWFGGCW